MSTVKPLAHKSDVPAAVKETIKYLSNQSGCKLKAVRTDNGGEYVNHELVHFFRSHGIQHQTTIPYNPEQNGKAERLNRTLLEKVRAMLIEADLPKRLWAEAANTASYLRNRTPTAGRSSTPWELFYGKKPGVSHLRVFGATAHMHIPEHQRDKLDSRSIRGIMVGYGSVQKGWRILLPDGTVKVSRDVVFDELHPSTRQQPGPMLSPLPTPSRGESCSLWS